MSDPRWYFTEEQLANSPSRKCGMNAELELAYRQRAANLIQEMGQRLQVSQLCINTAIVYMHRFYAFHSFTLFHRNSIAAAAFFLAAKVEEQPRKLEHVIKILNICLEKTENTRDTYAEQAQELVFNENVLLQTLGFDVAIDHPHTHVVKACQLFNIVTVSRELRQTCYFMASNSLHLTTMCLKYKPTVVAAFCIYIACQWSRWEIPESSEGKAWYSYVDENVTTDILKKLTDEYLQILERSPSKFKSKMKAITSNGHTGINQNPSVSRDDGPSTSSLHKPHDKHHHHHRSASSGSNHANRKQSESGLGSSSSSLTSKQPQTSSQTAPNYKNQPLASSSSHMQRPRPSSSSSSSQQPPYLGNNVTESSQKHVNEERTQHRQVVNQEAPTFPMLQRQIDSSRPRPSSSQASSMSSQQQQSSQHQQSHQKPTNHEQRHSQSSMGAKPLSDYHQKTMKPPQPEFPNRSSQHSQQQPPQTQQHKKQPSWTQQQPGVVNQQKPPAQNHIQSSQSQPNLNNAPGNGNSNSRNMPQSTLPSYNESTKQSASSQPAASNDFWFNDKPKEAISKVASPPRTTKSMFSPSPEHETFDRTKLLMMQAASAKRNHSPKSEKIDRRSSTPVKKEKKPDLSTISNANQGVSQQKLLIPKLEPGSSNSILPEQNKKRPFSAVDDGDLSRESKSRKVEPAIKVEPSSLVSGAMKQPIETNPDIVKSLLKECYTANSKFDSYGNDSPLDVINTEPTTQSGPSMLATTSFPPQVKLEPDLSAVKDEPQDNGYGDDHSRSKKSKKERKKDKHKSKKSKKSHKSDKSDREDRKDSLKIILSHKSDSPQDGMPAGGLKIKIPKNNFDASKSDLPPAPLKIKISKDLIGGVFNNSSQNLSDGGSSSSSSHKKKDKDRSKSKSSKHGNNNNNSDYKDAGYQHQQQQLPTQQQQPMNKMNSQVPMQQQQQHQQQVNNLSQNAYDYASMFSDNSFSQHGFFSQQQMPTTNSQGMEYHSFNDFFHNTSVNHSNHNSSNGGNKK